MSAEQTPDIAAVLAEHADWSAGGGSLICACDEKLCDLGGPVDLADCEEIHRAHVAEAFTPVLAAAVCEARDSGIAEGMAYGDDWRYCPQCGRHRDWVGKSSPGAPCMGCHRYPASRADRADTEEHA